MVNRVYILRKIEGLRCLAEEIPIIAEEVCYKKVNVRLFVTRLVTYYFAN